MYLAMDHLRINGGDVGANTGVRTSAASIASWVAGVKVTKQLGLDFVGLPTVAKAAPGVAHGALSVEALRDALGSLIDDLLATGAGQDLSGALSRFAWYRERAQALLEALDAVQARCEVVEGLLKQALLRDEEPGA